MSRFKLHQYIQVAIGPGIPVKSGAEDRELADVILPAYLLYFLPG
jgi:hypothetical protein